MFKTAGTVKDQAREAVREMEAAGETLCRIAFGDNGGELYLSSEKGVVMAFDVIEVDDRMYYLGFKK